MSSLDLVGLTALMDRTSGRPEIVIGLNDGPVAISHPDLAGEHIRDIPGKLNSTCARADAGILSAKRDSPAPAICPDCTLLVRPIFAETAVANGELPSATPKELAQAILACIGAGARVLNVSAALAQPTIKSERPLEAALDHAARHGVIVVAAAGNQGTLGSTAITRHPWVIPVAAYDLQGRPMGQSNLGSSIGRRGLGAPGDRITSLGADGKPLTLGGDKRRCAFCNGGDCAAVVGISTSDRGADKTRHHPNPSCTAELGGSAAAGCLGGVSVLGKNSYLKEVRRTAFRSLRAPFQMPAAQVLYFLIKPKEKGKRHEHARIYRRGLALQDERALPNR
jgi:subtilisin family serine protease